MLKSITVTNYLHDSVRIELDKPEDSGFIVENITGIGPGEANINSTEIATMDGGYFNSSRKNVRNIVLNLKFQETKEYPSIEEVRHKSYRYFPVKRPITISFLTDTWEVRIDGYVESNEPDIFNKEEGCQISILCPNPWFRGSRSQYSYSSGYEAMFEFPFNNELVPYGAESGEDLLDTTIPSYYFDQGGRRYNLQRSKGIVFGEIRNYVFHHEIFYDGTVETGFVMEIGFTENLVEDPYGTTDNSAGYIVVKNSRYPDKKIIIDLDKIKQLLPRCNDILAGPNPDNPEEPDEDGWYLLSVRDDLSPTSMSVYSGTVRLQQLFPPSISQFEEVRVSFSAYTNIQREENNLILTIYLYDSYEGSGSLVGNLFKEVIYNGLREYDMIVDYETIAPYLDIAPAHIAFVSSPNPDNPPPSQNGYVVYMSNFRIYGRNKKRNMIKVLSDPRATSDGSSDIVPIAQKGDILKIVTKRGERGIWYSKPEYQYNSAYEGSETSIMYWGKYQNGKLHSYKDDQFNILPTLNRDVEWFQIGPGYNRFEIYHTFHPEVEEIAEDEVERVHVDYLEVVVENDVLYEGV